MDSKISGFPVASGILPTDILPIVTGGANKSVTIGILALNMPNFGNKGITKNAVTPSTTPLIPLTNTLIALPVILTPYSLSNGSDGQEITLVSDGINVVVPTSSYVTSISMGIGSTITLVFMAGASMKWYPKSYHNCILT